MSTKSKTGKFNARVDFLVSFFTDNRMTTRLLSDVIKNKDDRFYAENLSVSEEVLRSFSHAGDGISLVYKVRQSCMTKFNATVVENPDDEHIIQGGDYLSFRSPTEDNFIKALFVPTDAATIAYKKYKLEKNSNIFIGRSEMNNIVYEFSDFVSREKHAAIHVDLNGDAFIEDLKRTVGVYVNGKLVHSQKLEMFDEIFLMGLSIVYMGDFIAVRDLALNTALPVYDGFAVKERLSDKDKNENYFGSTPRIMKSLDSGEIEVDAPPNFQELDKTPVILTLGPSLTMSMIMFINLSVSISNAIAGDNMTTVFTSGSMAILMLCGSLLWPLLLRSFRKRRTLADKKYTREKYAAYVHDIASDLEAKRERSVRLLNDTLFPSPEILCSMLENDINRLRLWERSPEDDDFLEVRVGLGARPFDVKIKIPQKKFQLHDNELLALPEKLIQKYEMLTDVPMTFDIRDNRTIGVIGDASNLRTILDEIILNIIALHPYDEVKLGLILSPAQASEYEFLKNVPHIWTNDKKVRLFATNTDEVHFIFNTINEVLQERESENQESSCSEKKAFRSHYVLIITEPSLIEREALQRYMNKSDNEVGLTTIFAFGDVIKLPKSCKTIIQSDSSRTGYYTQNKNKNRFVPFAIDTVDRQMLRKFVSSLSKLRVKRDARSLGIVEQISFLQMYKAGNVAELNIESHWDSNNSDKSLAAPIGVMAGNEVFSLDLHQSYHGCHGVVAGTTGSGKSEFLQAFVLSLAINYSPNEIAFVLVDFKGGDMARPFMAKPFSPALPHLAATISNLSGNMLHRALISLNAEIEFRERLFNEAAASLGVDKLDINSYHTYYKDGRLQTPLPHLIIIIDEFAQLKKQQPDFLEQLIKVAQVGRSLGIHLILATQKPSGIVDPQMMSNFRFKVCLKVADKQDSVDMINKPDSAMIKNPGRFYLQVGYDEIYECIQSGYSGVKYMPTKKFIADEEITVQMIDNAARPIHSARINLSEGKTDKTQLEAVVAEIVDIGQKRNISAKPLWLDVLPEKIIMSSLPKGPRGLCSATVALADHVRTQKQTPLVIDFIKTGHIGLYGAAGTGKTTFLNSLVYSMVCDYKYTPSELNIYAIDSGGRNLGYLTALPHTGGVVFADEEERLKKLVAILHDIIDERKKLFAANRCSTFSDYIISSKKTLPAVLVLIDDYASLHNKYSYFSQSIIDIVASGRAFGIYFVITGSTKDSIHYRVADLIGSYYALRMNDSSNYLDILKTRPPITPENISGRGITVINKIVVEFQVALAVDEETETSRMSYIADKYSEIAANWHGNLPISMDESVPASDDGDKNGSRQSQKQKQIQKQNQVDRSATVSEPETKSNLPEPVSDDENNLILGSAKSGAEKYGILLSEDFKICVCANEGASLGACYKNILTSISKYNERRAVFIDDSRGTFEDVVKPFTSCRYVKGQAELGTFIEDLKTELNARLNSEDSARTKQLFIIISDFSSFFEMISNEQAAFMRKMMQFINSPEYGICFICGYDINCTGNNDRLFMELIVNAGNYFFCPNSYAKALSKIEKLPAITGNAQNCFLLLKGRDIEVRW